MFHLPADPSQDEPFDEVGKIANERYGAVGVGVSEFEDLIDNKHFPSTGKLLFNCSNFETILP